MKIVFGYSLLEILICLGIIGLIALMTVPAYTSMLESRALLATAEAIAEDLRFARSEALKRNTDVNISYSVGEHWSYRIETGEGELIKYVDNRLPDFARTRLSENFRNDSTSFSPLRGSSEGKNGTLELVGVQTNSVLHIVLSNLGRVYICSMQGGMGGLPKCN